MFIFVLFKLFLSNPNSELLPIARLIPKSTPECPTDDRNYQHIEEEQSSYSSGKYFACNKKFRKPIIVDQGLLLLYNCNFTNTRSPTSSEGIIRIIATDESLTETIEIHNCHFYKTQYGAIHIEANEANIVNCSFEKCDTDSNTIASAIYFKIKTGSIKYSNFINNNGRENEIPDIKYENYNNEGRLTFEGNIFKRNAGSANDKSNIITFDSNSHFDFINNFVSIPIQAAAVKLFNWPQDLNNIDNYKFEGNIYYPNNAAALNNIIINGFSEKIDFECPPDSIEGSKVQNLCGSPFELSSSQALDSTNSLVNIIYCTFYSLTNVQSYKGGAVYIYVDENMPTYDEPIRIYNSDFVYCDAKYGCAIYIESYQDSLLFDFRDCYFGENYGNQGFDTNLLEGGSVWIATKYSPFEFQRCSFNENIAGTGSGLYFKSDTSESLEIEEKSNAFEYSLHLTDCRFHHNLAYSKGAGIFISIVGREHKKPVLIDNCIFWECFANNKDSDDSGEGEEPEYGGGLYYSSSYTKLIDSTNNHELLVNNCYFLSCMSSFRGAGIFVSIQNEEPSRCIEISECTFMRNNINENHCFNGECGAASDIFFEFNSNSQSSSSSSSSSTHLLLINKCYNYLSSNLKSSELITLYITDKEPTKSIEIKECTFNNNKGSISGVIHYKFYATTNSPSSNQNIYGLLVKDCKFKSNTGSSKGSAIGIEIMNIEPSNPIEIKGCIFDSNKAIQTENMQYGGSIYYFQKALTFSTNYQFSVLDCIFTGNQASYYGGAIYISVENAGETNHIEINNCSFSSNSVTIADNGIGASIYYRIYKQASTKSLSTAELFDDKVATFSVKNSNFTGGVATSKGEVYIEISADESTRTIEFTKCQFKDSNPDGIYFNSHSAFIHLNDCDFMTTSTIYFSNDAASAKVELCRFNDMKNHPITYKSESSSLSENHEFRIENCEFTQNENVDCLLYFSTQISSQFYFINNNIVINNEVTRALGSKTEMGENGWHFDKNTIKPGKEIFIKTENALVIPASCKVGFICDEEPTTEPTTEESSEESSKESSVETTVESSIEPTVETESPSLPLECNEHIRCDFNQTNNDEEISSVNLSNLHFNGNKYQENGAAIHIINLPFYCDESSFINCHAEGQHGGGGIYIYLDKVVQSPVELKNLKFTECGAKYGGAVFVYSDQEANQITITNCEFNQNTAQKKASNTGDVYFGGAAVFMAAVNGHIIQCKFNKNKGSGVKIYNDFEKLKENGKMVKLDSNSLLLINDCLFDSDENSQSSIFYLRGSKEETKVEVNNCIFKGKIADNSFYIDGDSLSKRDSRLNLHIKSCKFVDGNDSAFEMMKTKLLFASFENNEIQKIKHRSNDKIGLIALVSAGVACIAVISAFFILLIMKKNQQSNNHDNNIEL